MNWIQKLIQGCALALLANMSWAGGFDEQINQQVLQNNLAYGQLIELNQYSPGQQKGLMLRLFVTSAQDETCGLETGSTCKNQHLLTVATLDEYPEVKIHTLQAKGEFVKADWVVSRTHETIADQAELVLTFRQYHRFATRANPKLPKKFFQVNLKISRLGIAETLLLK